MDFSEVNVPEVLSGFEVFAASLLLLEPVALSQLIVSHPLSCPLHRRDSLCSAMCVKLEIAKLIAKWWCYDRGSQSLVQCGVCLDARFGRARGKYDCRMLCVEYSWKLIRCCGRRQDIHVLKRLISWLIAVHIGFMSCGRTANAAQRVARKTHFHLWTVQSNKARREFVFLQFINALRTCEQTWQGHYSAGKTSWKACNSSGSGRPLSSSITAAFCYAATNVETCRGSDRIVF